MYPLYKYLFNHSSTDEHLACFKSFAFTNSLTITVCAYDAYILRMYLVLKIFSVFLRLKSNF